MCNFAMNQIKGFVERKELDDLAAYLIGYCENMANQDKVDVMKFALDWYAKVSAEEMWLQREKYRRSNWEE